MSVELHCHTQRLQSISFLFVSRVTNPVAAIDYRDSFSDLAIEFSFFNRAPDIVGSAVEQAIVEGLEYRQPYIAVIAVADS